MKIPHEKMSILLVDDDDLYRETLIQNLGDDGYNVTEARNGEEALTVLQSGTLPDGVILDWNMPRMNGMQVLRWMRDQDIALPVLFLTGHNDQIYEESALDGGAADFIDKSRSYSILKKRLALVLNVNAPETTVDHRHGDIIRHSLTLRSEAKRALWKGTEIDLTVSEFDIVYLLASNPGVDIRFRQIYDVVHGSGFWAGHGEDGFRPNVRTFIKRIRKKFRDVDPLFDAIENYPGFGYRWTGGDS
ncbi:MAG: response regulator transcription factor [Alphaproteobacteria bacterium]